MTDYLGTAQYLLFHPEASFVRFTDGDAALIMGQSMSYQKAYNNLSEALTAILHTQNDKLMIGLSDMYGGPGLMHRKYNEHFYRLDYQRKFYLSQLNFSRQYLHAGITSITMNTQGTSYRGVPLVYDTLRRIWAGKDLVIVRGNNTQVYKADVFDTARSQTVILTPRYQAWSAYFDIKQQLLRQNPDSLYILMCGALCKVLTYELAQINRRALDLGHLAKDYDVAYGNRSNVNFFVD